MAKAVSHSLNNCVNCLPGQKDVDVALKSIGESSKKLLVDSVRAVGLGRGAWGTGFSWSLLPSLGSLSSLNLRSPFFFPADSPFPCFAFY